MKIGSFVHCFAGIVLSALFAISATGATKTQIVDPQFSYDAKKLAYLVANVDEKNGEYSISSAEIWTANRDGSGAKRLTKGRVDGNVRWSPDGKKIAFISGADIWLINTDGTGLKQITKTPNAKESSPEFSGDSKQLYFVRVEVVNAAAHLKNEKPIWIDGSGVVMAYNLATNTAAERFKSQDSVNQIVPNRADANEVFLAHKLYDPKVKTKYGMGGFTQFAISAVRVDGKGRRVLKTVPDDFEPPFQILRSTLDGLLIQQKNVSGKTEIVLLDKTGKIKPFKNGEKTLDVALTFSDISRDGKEVTGIRPVFVEVDGKREMQITIRIFDLAADDFTDLLKDALLGKASFAVASKVPTPKPVMKPEIVKPEVVKTEPPKTSTDFGPSAQAKKHYEEGNAQFAKTFYGPAIDEYSKAIELYPRYAEAYFGRGLCYAKRGDSDEALEDFSEAIAWNPNLVDAYLARADVYLLQAENELALADCNTAVRLAPNSPRAYRYRATMYYATGDNEKAAADDAKARELEKQKP